MFVARDVPRYLYQIFKPILDCENENENENECKMNEFMVLFEYTRRGVGLVKNGEYRVSFAFFLPMFNAGQSLPDKVPVGHIPRSLTVHTMDPADVIYLRGTP